MAKKVVKQQAPKLSPQEVEFIENRIRECRVMVARHHYPYLCDAVMFMSLVPSYGVPTMGVDKYWRCYYNPITVSSLTDGNICAILIHEVSHLVRRHAKRALPVHDIWNAATDMEINDNHNNMKDKSVVLPGNCYYPSTYGLQEDDIAEEYYDFLIKNKTKIEPDKDNSFGGSCSDGEKREWEADGNGNDAKSEQEAEWIIRKTAQNIKNQENYGNAPANMRLWADKILESKVNWRNKLRNLVGAIINPIRGKRFSSYKFPSRRSGELIFPGKFNPNPMVLVIVDTSGSMGGLENDCMAEVKGILRSVPSRNITFVSGDVQTVTKKRIRNVNQAELGGGGGTDMGKIIKDNWKGNDLVIVITDGYTPWCEPIPKPVIACLLNEVEVPNWIEPVFVKAEDKFRG